MDAIRFLRGTFVAGQPFGAGTVAAVPQQVSLEDASALVRWHIAEPAAEASKPVTRRRSKPDTDREPTP
jgi:hypothetical protein